MRVSGRLAAGGGLVVVGLLVWLLSHLQAGHEPRSYNSGGPPPGYVAVTAGRSYTIDVPGGAGTARAAGVDPGSLRCSIAGRGGGAQQLRVAAETNVKAVNELGSFTAPVSGEVEVRCDGLGRVYVDDADGAFDLAGLLLVLAVVLLAIGVPVLLSGVAAGQRSRGSTQPPKARSSSSATAKQT